MSEMRIGDAEREAAISALGEHYAAGRLTKDEYDERAEVAWKARTSSALRPLFADLPAPHGANPSSVRPAARPPARTPATRHRGFMPPLLPMLAIFLGVAMLTGHLWVFWVLLGLFWWARRSYRRTHPTSEWQRRCGEVHGWVQDWNDRGRPRRGW